MKQLYTGGRVLTEGEWNRLGWTVIALLVAVGIVGFVIGRIL